MAITGQRYAKIKPEILALYKTQKPVKKNPRGDFEDWYRVVKGKRIGHATYGSISKGDIVASHYAEAFIEWLLEKLPGVYGAWKIETALDYQPLPKDVWKGTTFVSGWQSLASLLTGNFERGEETYCQNLQEVYDAARIVLIAAGRFISQNFELEESEALKVGETWMKTDEETYKRQYEAWWKIDDRIINTIYYKGVKIGVTVVMGVSRETREQLLKGELDFHDLKEEHICKESNSLYVHAGAPLPVTLGPKKKPMDRAFSRAMVGQMVSLLQWRGWKDNPPMLISVAGTPEGERMLHAYGFRKNGCKTHITGHDVMVFQRPRRSMRSLQYLKYQAMTYLFRVFQYGGAINRNMEERRARRKRPKD